MKADDIWRPPGSGRNPVLVSMSVITMLRMAANHAAACEKALWHKKG